MQFIKKCLTQTGKYLGRKTPIFGLRLGTAIQEEAEDGFKSVDLYQWKQLLETLVVKNLDGPSRRT